VYLVSSDAAVEDSNFSGKPSGDISDVSDLSEAEFCQWLTREVGVAAIPLSAFYGDGFDQRVVRFCFAKKDETLNAALERLARL
jgi:methionine aminotransferase